MPVPMSTRSSNATGFVHFGGVVRSGNEGGRGLELGVNTSTTSTSYAPLIPTGDDGAIGLELVGKGTGSVLIGNSSTPVRVLGSTFAINSTQVTIGSTASSVVIGNSTTYLTGVQRYVVQFTEPDSPASTYVDSTLTVTGATTNASYKFTPRLILAAGYTIGDVRCSTADEVSIRWAHNGASTASGSTNRGTLLQFKY